MAETLRELVVSLSLESDSFSQNIKMVQGQIKEAESRFKAAGAGIDGFANKTAGLSAKAGMLADKLKFQSQIVGQYEQALKKANTTLENASQKNKTLASSLEAGKAKYATLKTQIEQTRAAYQNSVKTTGDNSEASNKLGLELMDLEEQYKATGAEVKKLEGQLTANSKSMVGNAASVTKAETALNDAKAAEAATRAELDKTNRSIATHKAQWDAAAQSLKKFGDRATASGQNLTNLGQSLTTYVTAPILALGTAGVAAFNQLDDGLDTIAKKTGATGAELSGMEDAAVSLFTSMNITMADAGATVSGVSVRFGVTGEALDTLSQAFLQFANINDTDVNTSVETTARLMEQFHLSAADAESFMGLLTATSQRTGLTMGNLMSTLEANGATFKELGFTVEESINLIGQMEAAGVNTDTAMAGLKKSVINLTKGGMPLEAALGTIIDKIKNASTETQALEIAQKTFGTKGAAEMTTAIREGRFSVQDLSASMSSYAGVVSKTYGTVVDSSDRAKAAFNKVENAGRQLGEATLDALAPAMEAAAEKVQDLGNWFGELDPQMQGTVLQTAALVAAIGPGIALIGKLNTGVGSLATGLSTAMAASVEAGGGLSGLFAASSSLLGPVGIAALAAAALYGTYMWIDYASGAKAAREATEAMMKTAQEWKENQATTIFDTGNDPLARFGMSKESFTGGQTELEDWLSRLNETWTDGKSETGAIIKGYVDEFKTGSDKIREAIKARKKTQEKFGVVDDKTTAEDLKKLDKYDKQVAALLKKKKNGKLSEKDQQTLDTLIQERVDIQLKYTTGEGGSYESLTAAVEAEKARLASEGKTPGADLYGDTLTGAAQGYTAQVDAINQSYRDQYTDIMAITDEKEREAALTQLNLEHTQALKTAQEEYNKVVSQYAPPAFQTPEIQQAQKDMETLQQKIADFQTGKIDATELKAFTDSLDEGKLASYLALLKQLQEGGQGNVNLGTEGGPVITASSLLGGYNTVADYLKANAGTLTGLGEMLGAATGEANRVLVDMGLTPEGQTLKDWIDGHQAFTLTGTLTAVTGNGQTFTVTDATINADGTLTGVDGNGKTFTATNCKVNADGTLTGVTGDGQTFTVTNASITANAILSGVDGAGSAFIVTNATITADGILTGVTGDGKTFTATNYTANADGTLTGVDGNGNAFAVTGATVTVPATLSGVTGDGQTFAVTNATVAADGTLTGVTGDGKTFTATNYKVNADGTLTGVDGNGQSFTVSNAVVTTQATLSGVTGAGQTFVVTDATVKVIATATPYEPGSPESVNFAKDKMGQKPNIGLVNSTAADVTPITNAINEIDRLQAKIAEMKAAGSLWDENGIGLGEYESALTASLEAIGPLLQNLNVDDISNIAINIKALMDALASGTLTPEDTAALQAQLASMLAVVQSADQYLGVGNDISSGIATGMKAYGWTGDAATLASSIETSIRGATGSHSPATKFVPVGVDIAAGVAKGVEDGTYKVENAMVKMAKAAIKAAKAAMVIQSPSHVMRDQVGVMIPRGVVVGIEEETARQQRAVSNAFRTLVQPALSGAMAGANDNRKTVNNNSAINFDGANFVIRDKQDIRALAMEINGLQISQARALGGTP